jgi:type IV pilus assembly protein PilF
MPWYNLGILAEQGQDPQSAERNYRKALELDPDATSVRENLGILLAEQKRYQEAVSQFRAAGSFVNLGRVLALAGQRQEAEEAYREALRRDSNNMEARRQLAALPK